MNEGSNGKGKNIKCFLKLHKCFQSYLNKCFFVELAYVFTIVISSVFRTCINVSIVG